MKVARRIKALRKRLHLSQGDLALRAGLTLAEVYDLEQGQNQGSSVKVHRGLAEAASVSVDAIGKFLEGQLSYAQLSICSVGVAPRIKAFRKLLNLSQAQLARRAGLTRAEVNALEHGRNQGSSARVRVGLAKAANIPVERMEDYLVERLSLEQLAPHQTPLERLLELEPDRWGWAAVVVAQGLSRKGLDLSPLEWGYRLDTLQKALLPVVPKKHWD